MKTKGIFFENVVKTSKKILGNFFWDTLWLTEFKTSLLQFYVPKLLIDELATCYDQVEVNKVKVRLSYH